MNQQYNIDERLSYPISSIVIVPSSIESMKEWRKNDARRVGKNYLANALDPRAE